MPRLRPLPTRRHDLSPKRLARRKNQCSIFRVRLTTERKVFAGVLALAVVALGVDRLFLGGGASGPAVAGAALVTDAAASAPTPDVAAHHAGPAVVTAVPVAKQLAALQSVARDVDAFVPPARWQEVLAKAAASEDAPHRPNAREATAPTDKATLQFQQNQLTAILIEGSAEARTARALIKVAADGDRPSTSRLFSIGDELGGYRLVRIDAASVEFKPLDAAADGRSVTLSLPAPIEGGGITAR